MKVLPADGGSFPPARRREILEIFPIFLRFRSLILPGRLTKNPSPSARKDIHHGLLKSTSRVAREIADDLATVPEVTHLQLYVGTAAPINFNGLVRHYNLRQGANVADPASTTG